MQKLSSECVLTKLALLLASMFVYGNAHADDIASAKLLNAPVKNQISTIDGKQIAAADASTSTSSSTSFASSFNPSFLSSDIDYSRFEKNASAPAGVYRSDIYLNEILINRRDIEIRSVAGKKETFVCIDQTLVDQLGIILPNPSEYSSARLNLDLCINLESLIPDSKVTFDLSELRADISVPQLYLKRNVRGYVNESEWDEGINAGFLTYAVSGSRNEINDITSNQLYANLNWGLNLYGWRIRQNSSYSVNQYDNRPTTTHGNSIASYAQHDVTSLKSQLTIGESYTGNSTIFDSVPFTGLQLTSDDRMLPYSQRGYAPVIRGVVETNARVQIRQSNNLVLETTVSPGPFEINDLYSNGYGGDYQVTIIEADGRKKQFIVPNSAGVQLLRPGAIRYSATVGRLRDNSISDKPYFAQGTFQRGFGNSYTGYGGFTASKDYYSGVVGLAVSTPIGGVSADITQSFAKEFSNQDNLQGQSLRLTYSNLFQASKTNLTLAAYRYSTQHYLSFNDATALREAINNPNNIGITQSSSLNRPQSRLQLNISQPINNNSSFFLTGQSQNYWNVDNTDTSFNLGYNHSFSWGSANISVGRTSNLIGGYSNQILASVYLPIGNSMSNNRPMLSTSIGYNDKDNNNAMLSLSGVSGEENRFSYNATSAYQQSNGVGSSNLSGSVQYNSSKVQLGATASRGQDYRQGSLSANGSVIVHSGGLIFSPDLGETMGIVEAIGLEGAAISGSNSIINGAGYGLISNLTPYMRNEVNLDPRGTSMDIELDSTSQTTTPRAGAIIKLRYATTMGSAYLVVLERPNGEKAPIGATVVDENKRSIGMVVQGGRIFTRLLTDAKTLTVQWGKAENQQCFANVFLPPKDTDLLLQKVTLMCSNSATDKGYSQALPTVNNPNAISTISTISTKTIVNAMPTEVDVPSATKNYPVLIDLYQTNGQVIPAGAEVLDLQNNVLGLVHSGSKFFGRNMPTNGALSVRWNDGKSHQCQFEYAISETSNPFQDIKKTRAICQ